MKAIIISLLAILLAAVLIIGNIEWRKNHSSLSSHQKTNSETETTNTNKNSNNSKTASSNSIPVENYIAHADAWPKSAKKQFEIKLQDKKSFHIVLLGSQSIGDEKTGLLPIIKEKLADTYDKYVTIESIVYDDTSANFIENGEVTNLVNKKPDMILFEPFTLNDNNIIDMNQSVINVKTIMDATKQELPDVTFILQPPNQIEHATIYPLQVRALKTYAEENQISYLNHWENWPAGDSSKIEDYINKDDTPNEKGYEVWGDYINQFLVKE
ncbi:MAG: SGNH/GDSL hydrolase family protein [Bacillus sp. (in: firmicutes)]